GYVPGTNYTITVSIAGGTARKGFQVSPQNASGVLMGTLTAGTGNRVVSSKYVTHTSAKTSNPGTWTFTWTAPATGANPVVFFVAGNAVNLNNNAQNDAFNTDNFSFNPAQTAVVPTYSNLTATNISQTSATLNVNINAENSPTNVIFNYGTTTQLGSTITPTPSLVTGTVSTPVTANLTGLLPNTTYHFNVSATNSIGTLWSAQQQFITSPTGVPQLNQTSGNAYPNPCTHQLIYEHPIQPALLVFAVYNDLGQRIPIHYQRMGTQQYSFDIGFLPLGNYQLHWNDGVQHGVVSFTKQ
ncbi:MAG: hypothetical protein FGM54_00995, partial [Chitinophagaceae bacterium]|nr:hypothetical protein [Chitinophagaceae bacterium]